MYYFSYHPWIAASKVWNFTTQEHQHPRPILLEFRHPSPPLCKNHKKPEVDKKLQTCEILTLTESFVFFSCRSLKQSVSRLLIRNWSEYFIGWGCFQICGRNNNALLLYDCEVIPMINKGVISPYVQG